MIPAFEGTFHYWGSYGRPAHCWVRVFTDPDRPAVVIASEAEDNPGTSIANAAETLAAEVCRRLRIDSATLLWVEHFQGDRYKPERFALVEFRDDQPHRPGALGRPVWSPITRERVEGLIGCIVTSPQVGPS